MPSLGKVCSSNSNGLKVTLLFFDDILIPHHLFPSDCVYDPVTLKWIWKFKNDEDPSQEAADLPLEIGAKV